MKEAQAKAQVLLEALPYIRRFGGKCFVIKIGGELLEDDQRAASFAEDVVLLSSIGIRIVLCHGGGPQVSRAMAEAGLVPEFKKGLRVTNQETLEITARVLLGDVNRKLVSLLNSFGSKAVGVSGLDSRLFECEPVADDLGFVGRVLDTDMEIITSLCDQKKIPVVASIGAGPDESAYNINADEAAGALAMAVNAEKYVVISNVEGILADRSNPQSKISAICAPDLSALLESGAIMGGMVPKVQSVLGVLASGVQSVHLLDGRIDHVLLLEIFTDEGIGTMIVESPKLSAD